METPDNQETKTKKELMLERLRAKYPDNDFEDDEAIFARINDDFDDFDNKISERDKELEEYKEREGTFAGMFNSDPRSARLMAEWKHGIDPAVNLVRLYGTEIKDAIDDPEKQEAIAEANKEYMDRVAESNKYEEEYKSNLSDSLAYLDKLQAEGMSEEEIDNVMELLLTIVRDGIMGKFTSESIEMAKKALNHERDVEEAAADAEIRGRNAKIEEKLRKAKKGDGTSPLSGNNGNGPQPPAKSLGALDGYGKNNRNIFERGGEKRIKTYR